MIAERVVAAAAMEGLALRLRQDQPAAQHARLPSPDPVVAQRHRSGQHEAAADGALLLRRRRPDRPEDADPGRRSIAAWTAIWCAGFSPATPTSTAIESEANAAKEAGIDGVPCFIFGGSIIVTGAQSPEYLASAIERTARQHTKARA